MANYITADDIREKFSHAMSAIYQLEVPQYGTLLELVADVNLAVLENNPDLHQQLENADELARLNVERHGVIRVGKPEELVTLRRIFAVMGMMPVGYYDLSQAGVPVHSTAFRPVDETSLTRNPFRVFTSLLRLELVENQALRKKAASILAKRDIFTPRCYELLDVYESQGGFNEMQANEFVTYYPDAVKPELLERRVIVDESNVSWRYADSFDSSGLNVEISEGKRQIRLHGENYELHQNGAGKYEIVVNKASGIKEFVPVYMEPLSRTWHISTHNGHPVFSNKQADIIKEIKVNKEDGFSYIPRGNNNPNYYGSGKIFSQEQIGDSGHYPWGQYIEMNGELVPVKTIITPKHGLHYEVCNLNEPSGKSHPVEWDGNRWLFERKTSVHVSKDLKKLISPGIISEKVDAGKLSAPDHQGLRYDAEGNKYIKIRNKYIKLEQRKGLPFIRESNGDRIYVDYINNKFIPKKQATSTQYPLEREVSVKFMTWGMDLLIKYTRVTLMRDINPGSLQQITMQKDSIGIMGMGQEK